MKKKTMFLVMSMILFTGFIFAQVTKDSINSLINEKDRLKIAKTLNENKLKMAKMENDIAGRTANLDQANIESQRAADENRQAADDLASDPQDKSKAKKASKSARYAERSSKNARKASEKLDDLNNDISDMRKKIADQEQKLAAMGGSVLDNN